MSKHKPNSNGKGSLRQIQEYVNNFQQNLNQSLKEAIPQLKNEAIQWTSPLENARYEEFRDGDFLEAIGHEHLIPELRSFWPNRGPQWDALAKTQSGKVILVEAKSNIPELKSSCKAKSEHSLKMIEKAIEETQRYLGVKGKPNWKDGYYQYANRLAHLLFLRSKGIDAFLIFVFFLNDISVNGPKKQNDWCAAQEEMYESLGLKLNWPEPPVYSIFLPALP